MLKCTTEGFFQQDGQNVPNSDEWPKDCKTITDACEIPVPPVYSGLSPQADVRNILFFPQKHDLDGEAVTTHATRYPFGNLCI